MNMTKPKKYSARALFARYNLFPAEANEEARVGLLSAVFFSVVTRSQDAYSNSVQNPLS